MGSFDSLRGQLPAEVIDSLGDEIRAFDTSELAEKANISTEIVKGYVDSTNGNDSNDGLGWDRAKKTLQAGADLLPNIVGHNCSLQLRGTFTDEELRLNKLGITPIAGYPSILISGVNELDTLDGPYTADISSVNTIGLSTLSLTVDEHYGRYVEILSGPALGQKRLIVANSATTVTVRPNFSVDPGGAEFKIGEWATKLAGSSKIRDSVGGGFIIVRIQQLTLNDSSYIIASGSSHSTSLSNIVANGTGLGGSSVFMFNRDGNIGVIRQNVNPETFAFDNTLIQGGVGQVNTGAKIEFNYGTCSGIQYCALRKAVFKSCLISNWNIHETTVKGPVEAYSCQDPNSYLLSSGEIVNSAGPGVLIEGGEGGHRSGGGVLNIHDCGGNGIEIRTNASFKALANAGNLQGSNNSNFGLYAHGKSLVTFPDGKAPSISGTSGQVTTDGATQASTWPAIDGGTPVVDANELTLVKEI